MSEDRIKCVGLGGDFSKLQAIIAHILYEHVEDGCLDLPVAV